MGVQITKLLTKKEITIDSLRGRILVIDAFNILYQFLTTIRARDGTPLTNSKGATTSHLIGLFARTTTLMSKGLKLVFIFDGKAPELKKKERERRQEVKKDAQARFDAAQASEDVDEMRKYASRTVRLTPEMVLEAKKLLTALGIPIVQAPSEGEAQAAYMVKKGDAYAVVSQDADALLFAAPRVIRNLGVSGRKKKTNTLAYEKNNPELIELEKTLKELSLSQEQLITLAILTGTDFAPGGVKGLGPKKALKLVSENKLEDIEQLSEWSNHQEVAFSDVLSVFHDMPTTDEYELTWSGIDEQAIKELLVNTHEFSVDRVDNALQKLETSGQKGLNEFF